VLKVAKIKAADKDRQNYYTDLAREDYYARGGEGKTETALRWWGRDAEKFGLRAGELAKASELKQLFQGVTPNGLKVRNANNPQHVSAHDFTFSLGKTWSAFYSQCTAEEKRIFEYEVREAAREVLTLVEDVAAWTRRGRGGHVRERLSGVLMAETLHMTARATMDGVTIKLPSPQLHVHALLLNIGITEDGQARTLDSEMIYSPEFLMAGGFLIRDGAAARLERRFGILSKRGPKHWQVEVDGPKELDVLADGMSPRSKDIKRYQAVHGLSGSEAGDKAALATRLRKVAVNPDQLHDDWKAQGKAAGFTNVEAKALFGRAPERDRAAELAKALRSAAEQMDHERASFTEHKFLEAVCLHAAGRGVTATEILTGVKEYLRSNEMVYLGERKKKHLHSTRTNYVLEVNLVRLARLMRETNRHRVPSDAVEASLKKYDFLSSEQKSAVRNLTGSPHQVACLLGKAGAGKSTALLACREIWEKCGYTVVGAATSATAVQGLKRSSGIESYTIAKLIGWGEHVGDFDRPADGKRKPVHLHDKSILVIDEAGMVGTKALYRLIKEAEAKGARVVCVGDPGQLQPVGEGGAPLGYLASPSMFGAAKLTRVIRQRSVEDRKALEAFSEGRPREAIQDFDRRGKVSVSDSPIETLLADWVEARGVEDPQNARILARRNAEVNELNERCQRVRKEAGILGAGFTHGSTTFHLLDQVQFRKNDYRMGVRNSDTGTITGIDPVRQTLRVKLFDGSTVTVPLREYQHVKLGYAMTSYSSQSKTYAASLVLASAQTSREQAYVEFTRHRDILKVHIATDQAGENLERFIKATERSERKKLAIEVAEEIEQERGM
jgi:conjugative relaxase-like TrwC/TraI family protein